MRASRLFFVFIFFSIPLQTAAAVTAGDLPGDTVWYMHADLAAMRNTESGARIYAWFEDEVADDVREEIGIDLSTEVNSITAVSDATNGTLAFSCHR